MELRLEPEPFQDAVETLRLIAGRIHKRHGARFRDLERRLELIADSAPPKPTITILDGDRFVILPPQEWLDIITEAKALGVI